MVIRDFSLVPFRHFHQQQTEHVGRAIRVQRWQEACVRRPHGRCRWSGARGFARVGWPAILGPRSRAGINDVSLRN
jgi:hypothetical protein